MSEVKEAVRSRYANAAKQLEVIPAGAGCCSVDGPDCGCAGSYSPEQLGEIGLTDSVSLGCGNPTLLADLKPGEVVLDLGSGAGLDVLLSARRVAPGGYAYGVDMTDDMIALAHRNRAKAGISNATFLVGSIDSVPLADASVDVVISNCVINLSTDKSRVLREVARVLRPGGRFAVSDVVADPDLDDDIRRDMAQWTGCIAGALTVDQYRSLLKEAGLTAIEVNETHRVHPHAGSAIIRASKPAEPRGGAPLPPGVVRLQGPGFLHVPITIPS
jgi:arsenite methyltransferase